MKPLRPWGPAANCPYCPLSVALSIGLNQSRSKLGFIRIDPGFIKSSFCPPGIRHIISYFYPTHNWHSQSVASSLSISMQHLWYSFIGHLNDEHLISSSKFDVLRHVQHWLPSSSAALPLSMQSSQNQSPLGLLNRFTHFRWYHSFKQFSAQLQPIISSKSKIRKESK